MIKKVLTKKMGDLLGFESILPTSLGQGFLRFMGIGMQKPGKQLLMGDLGNWPFGKGMSAPDLPGQPTLSF